MDDFFDRKDNLTMFKSVKLVNVFYYQKMFLWASSEVKWLTLNIAIFAVTGLNPFHCLRKKSYRFNLNLNDQPRLYSLLIQKFWIFYHCCILMYSRENTRKGLIFFKRFTFKLYCLIEQGREVVCLSNASWNSPHWDLRGQGNKIHSNLLGCEFIPPGFDSLTHPR